MSFPGKAALGEPVLGNASYFSFPMVTVSTKVGWDSEIHRGYGHDQGFSLGTPLICQERPENPLQIVTELWMKSNQIKL